MEERKLKEALFSERTRVYVVLDGASVADLRMKLYEMPMPNFCLYRGELEPDMAEVAPYLIHLAPDVPFTNWLLKEGWGRHWGIFAHCVQNITEMRKHFRRFLTVHDETGNPLLFRYYDPRVLQLFLPTCDQNQLGTMFGNVTKYFAESTENQNLLVFEFGNGQLKQSEIELNTKQQ